MHLKWEAGKDFLLDHVDPLESRDWWAPLVFTWLTPLSCHPLLHILHQLLEQQLTQWAVLQHLVDIRCNLELLERLVVTVSFAVG